MEVSFDVKGNVILTFFLSVTNIFQVGTFLLLGLTDNLVK